MRRMYGVFSKITMVRTVNTFRKTRWRYRRSLVSGVSTLGQVRNSEEREWWVRCNRKCPVDIYLLSQASTSTSITHLSRRRTLTSAYSKRLESTSIPSEGCPIRGYINHIIYQTRLIEWFCIKCRSFGVASKCVRSCEARAESMEWIGMSNHSQYYEIWR